jgi:hypothetical protein
LLAGERPIRAFLGGNTEFCLHWLGEERLESQHNGQAPHQKTGRFEGQANRRRKTRDSVVALEGCESTEKAVYFIQEPSIVAWHPNCHLSRTRSKSLRRRIMTMATIFAATANRQELTWLKTICLLFLLVHLVSGCALLNNSVKFYQNQPRRPINWREYTSD